MSVSNTATLTEDKKILLLIWQEILTIIVGSDVKSTNQCDYTFMKGGWCDCNKTKIELKMKIDLYSEK